MEHCNDIFAGDAGYHEDNIKFRAEMMEDAEVLKSSHAQCSICGVGEVVEDSSPTQMLSTDTAGVTL